VSREAGGTVRRRVGVLRDVHRHGTTARTGVPTGDGPADPASGAEASRTLRAVARTALLLHLVLLGWLTLRPLPVGWTYPANLTPLASVDRALALGGFAGVRELATGVLPLAPLGVLLPLAGGRLRTAWLPSFLHTTGAVALIGTAREFLAGWAPGHVLNVDDILLGIAGAALCHLAVLPALRALLLRRTATRHRRPVRVGPHAQPQPQPQPHQQPHQQPRPPMDELLGRARLTQGRPLTRP